MKMIDRPVTSSDFTIKDIHALRRYNYEVIKDLSQEERLKYYNDPAFREEVRKCLSSENVICCKE